MMRAFGGGSSSSRCKDCGNKAKRDCGHKRCRTCCKGKGFECQTHIKSTWVNPSTSPNNIGRSQNKHKTQTQTLLHDNYHHHDLIPSSAHHVHQHNPKRLRLNPSTGFEEEEMERNFRAPDASFPATLRCIRVSSNNKDDSGSATVHYAYQTSVSIGGHVFKGILYDQGMDPPTPDHHFLAEPHQPNLSNIAHHHHHHALMASSDHDHDHDHQEQDHFSSLVQYGMEFCQHSLPKS